jgi:hypothetical protein
VVVAVGVRPHHMQEPLLLRFGLFLDWGEHSGIDGVQGDRGDPLLNSGSALRALFTEALEGAVCSLQQSRKFPKLSSLCCPTVREPNWNDRGTFHAQNCLVASRLVARSPNISAPPPFALLLCRRISPSQPDTLGPTTDRETAPWLLAHNGDPLPL